VFRGQSGIRGNHDHGCIDVELLFSPFSAVCLAESIVSVHWCGVQLLTKEAGGEELANLPGACESGRAGRLRQFREAMDQSKSVLIGSDYPGNHSTVVRKKAWMQCYHIVEQGAYKTSTLSDITVYLW
jgi:hypothetical protein